MVSRYSYSRLLFPLLTRLDPEKAHERTLRLLGRAQSSPAGRTMLRQIAGEIPEQPVDLWGLRFPNQLGVAAGYDKDAQAAAGLALLGFGHVEIGTITPWPQPGNPRPRVFRLKEDRALINRMGFPNGGMVAVSQRLRSLAEQERAFVLGASLGKQKQTRLAEAVTDYVTVMRSIYEYADYLVVNISSPNTPGLRRLQTRRFLAKLLSQVASENRNLSYVRKVRRRPMLVKVAPDIAWSDLDDVLEIMSDNRLDGIIATNTTTAREGLLDRQQHEEGGLSGAPLASRSNAIIRYIAEHTEGKMPIIGVGGVFSAADVLEKLEAGASLVQVYTGLVYEGPGMAGRVLRELAGQ